MKSRVKREEDPIEGGHGASCGPTTSSLRAQSCGNHILYHIQPKSLKPTAHRLWGEERERRLPDISFLLCPLLVNVCSRKG